MEGNITPFNLVSSFFTFFTDLGNEANTNCYLIAFIRAE